MTNADEWRRNNFGRAVGRDRNESLAVGIADLCQFADAAKSWGHAFDAEIEDGGASTIRSMPSLFELIDPQGRIRTRAGHRIRNAHKLDVLGLLVAVMPIVHGRLPVPAGGLVSVSTCATTLAQDVDGVTLRSSGDRTRTLLTYSLVGGSGARAWALPVLHEPAHDPTDGVKLGLQALRLGRKGRELVREVAPRAGYVSIGSLPILLGPFSTARADDATRPSVSPPFALPDVPRLADELATFTRDGIPYVAQACIGPTGDFALPAEWQLYIACGRDRGSERPTAVNGVIMRTRERFRSVLFMQEQELPDSRMRLMKRLADVPGIVHVTTCSVVVPTPRGPLFVRAASHLTDEGRASAAITNIPDDEHGHKRLGLALDGLFGSLMQRERCRARAVDFTHRFELPTQSPLAARRALGIAVVAYADTVIGRVGRPSR